MIENVVIVEYLFPGLQFLSFKLQQEKLYDVNWNMPVEPFHLLIIGLIPWHISFILDDIFSAKEYDLFVSKYNSYKTKYNLPALKGMRRWQGDDWIKVFPFILFIFKEPLKQRPCIYKCLFMHMQFTRKVLQETITLDQIDQAEKLCAEWRVQAAKLYGESAVNFPNFHNVVHLFHFIREWGPCVLYWARPFEHKHKTFN